MVLSLKVNLKNAEKWKQFLKMQNLFENNYKLMKKNNFIYFPIKRKIELLKSEAKIVDIKLEMQEEKKTNLKDLLKNKLSEKEFSDLVTSYDVVGSIAIIEIPKELGKKEKIIADAILKINKNVKTVLKKDEKHSGTFRTRTLKHIAGINTRETVYRENNADIKIDVEKVYFSARLSSERLRIAKLIKKGENVLVMFSGSGVYPIVIGKNSDAKTIYGIEINPTAHKYALENISLNKMKMKIKLFLGDVKKIIPKIKDEVKFDRIIMPLPKTAENFLNEALLVSKKSTIIHFYNFSPEEKINEIVKKIDSECKKRKIKYKILKTTKCGQVSKNLYRICVDFKII